MIDVCLLLEGTYPYVAGGVSTWVHQLISAMKDIRFGIVFIAANSDPTRTLKYKIPGQVIYLKEITLHDYRLERLRSREPKPKDFDLIRLFYEQILKNDPSLFVDFIKLFRGNNSCLDTQTIFSSRKIWDALVHFYDLGAGEISFADYFWTWRGTHLPLVQILKADLPRARVYHSVSTGYAGLLGVIAKLIYPSKFLLTEHGIYTHERMLEISQAGWIFEQENRNYRAERGFSFFKKWWIQIFEVLSSLAYHYSDKIYTLYEGNKIKEILHGADSQKIEIIPNGIDINAFDQIVREKRESPQIGLIGRVVGIKDIKTFIQSARLTIDKIPEAQFYIIGPTDEEAEYYEECKLLVEALNLEKQITFTGRVDPKKYYQFLDVIVLTSLSEAQPYVILEGNVVGIPVVASDVGACREMLEGTNHADRAIGPSGIITQVSNPEDTSSALVKLLTNDELYNELSEAGKMRVRRYYDQDDLLSRYINIYEKNL